MPEPITVGALGAAFAKGGAMEGGRRAVKYACDNAENITKAANKEIDKGWERDRKAGGISSLGNQSQTEYA